MHVNIYKSILYYIIYIVCLVHVSATLQNDFVICPAYCTSLRMATSVAEACRRHLRTLEQLCAFVGFITIPKQAFFVWKLTHTFKRSEGKFLHLKYLCLCSDALHAVFGVGCYVNQQSVSISFIGASLSQ